VPLRFFKLDRTHWTQNILAAFKFGVACGVFQGGFPYLVAKVMGVSGNNQLWTVNRIAEGFVNMVLFGLLYYVILVLLDETYSHH
jgi:hypothetical protein